MNIYQNTQLGGLIHKLSKYQTLLARAPSHKANVYESKVNSYKNQLSQIGYGMNQEGGAYRFDNGEIKDDVGTVITPAQLVTQIQASNTAYSEQSKNLGNRYNAIIGKLQDVFQQYVLLSDKLKQAEADLLAEKAAHNVTQQKVVELEAQKVALQQQISALEREKTRLEVLIANLEQQLTLAGAQIARLQGELDTARRELADVTQQLEIAKQELARVNQQLLDANAEIAVQKTALQKCNTEVAKLTEENTKLSGQIGTATAAINQLANVTFTPPQPVDLQGINIAARANMSPDVRAVFNQLMNDPTLQATSI